MAKYRVDLVVIINTFEAENDLDADRKINAYIDRLAEIKDPDLTWDVCDYTIIEELSDLNP